MSILRHIELFLDSTYALTEQKRFIFCSRCICNFLEKSLVPLQFSSPYSRLNIHCSRDPESVRVRPLKHERFLEICINFDLPPLDSLSPEVLQRQFIRTIISGLEAASGFTPVPVHYCVQVLKEFEDSGFVNRWVHLDKFWVRSKCRCVISAELTMNCFSLDQLVYLDGQLVASRRIGETKPREWLFSVYLGGLSISSQGILEYKRKSQILTAFDLDERRFLECPLPP